MCFKLTSFLLIVCILISAGSANSKGVPKVISNKTVLTDGAPQPMEQTFNINNWGLGEDDRKLLMEMKSKIDFLYDKSGKGMLRFQ